MKTTNTTAQQDISGSYVTPDGKAQIDFGITYRNGYAEFTASGHFNGSCGQCIEEIAAAYPNDPWVKTYAANWRECHLKAVDELMVKIISGGASMHPARCFCHAQADTFLASNGIKLRVTLSDSKPAPWQPSGHHYRVTLSRPRDGRIQPVQRLTFDYFGSAAAAEKGEHPHAYDVLVCISGDAYCPDTFIDWCAEYGESDDSLKARQTWRRCHTFAKRLQSFFTPDELEQLGEIR